MCLTPTSRVDAERARRLAGILKFADTTAGNSFLGHSRLMTALAKSMANSRVSAYSGGLNNKL